MPDAAHFRLVGAAGTCRLVVTLVAFLSLIGAANAQSVRLIGDYRDWSAYSASEGAGALCFAMSKPTEVTPTPDGYTAAYLYLTNRPGEGVSNEFNLVAGFNFAPDQPATLSVGGQTFELFTEPLGQTLTDLQMSLGERDCLAATVACARCESVEVYMVTRPGGVPGELDCVACHALLRLRMDAVERR